MDDWLRSRFTPEQHRLVGGMPLVAMPLSVEVASAGVGRAWVPDDVIAGWAHMNFDARRKVDQSDASMIALLIRQGWTWDDIAFLLGFEEEREAQEWYADLAVRLWKAPLRRPRLVFGD
ncbi:hypothetical protein KCV87_20865 [Actinosynnema pretiosum subsp. pretiosum]|uniref:Uncharacterized protein n=2 Tax=Actinosynnema TaxID=40566 RepID=C6WSE5_ACTMD|nr:hypothetical protein [Actinosynnema mirum]ACU40815.1 hypothetical protein Amir_7023 [Actinosynnema mirum DSM 43827]AXX34322.1 hypothetical protein APASM_6957 [Actinosynnema pretiosum subsp. pretiosum]QUF01976.1 hypothetical protein KCV87_20865 [Actinosynnema pretiosum subsp. pretiosum]